MKKRYLFFAERAYAFEIMRPLQDEIRRRGNDAAWLLGDECPDLLNDGEQRLTTVAEAIDFSPFAVFAPGDWVYPQIPGVKVKVFHGYPINKRGNSSDAHFRMRGWFDIYMTAGPSSTPRFSALAESLGYFSVYETGWCKTDSIVAARKRAESDPEESERKIPRIFVGSTFSHRISALREFYPVIKELAERRNWEWIVTRHPMLDDPELDAMYSSLAAGNPRVKWFPNSPGPDVMARTDAMLCDASSIIMEYEMLDKPVVTLRNTVPGPHLLNVDTVDKIENALETALRRPPKLMEGVRRFVASHESHLYGHNSAAILDAVDDFVANRRDTLRPKPLNLFRRIKLRWRMLRRGIR